jgi:hypothetical protein
MPKNRDLADYFLLRETGCWQQQREDQSINYVSHLARQEAIQRPASAAARDQHSTRTEKIT